MKGMDVLDWNRVFFMLRQAQHEGLARPLTLSLSKGENHSGPRP